MGKQIEMLKNHSYFLPQDIPICMSVNKRFPPEPNIAMIDFFEPVHTAKQSAFPGSRRPDDNNNFPAIDVKTNSPQHLKILKIFYDIRNGEDWFNLAIYIFVVPDFFRKQHHPRLSLQPASIVPSILTCHLAFKKFKASVQKTEFSDIRKAHS
jgi:hypothetical protein